MSDRMFCMEKRVSDKSSIMLNEMPDGTYAIQTFRITVPVEQGMTQRMVLSPAAMSALYVLIGHVAIDKITKEKPCGKK